ncbi:MAG: GAF domain-containing protein [Myxococcales bacterium]|nr:GAF domain-containing protein [Myxococcales bacterium]
MANATLIGDNTGLNSAKYLDARIRAAQGDEAGAERAAQAALTLTAADMMNHAGAWSSSGMTKLFRGDLEGATGCFRRALSVAWKNSITQEYWVVAIPALAEAAVLQCRSLGASNRAALARALRLCRFARLVPLVYPVYGPMAHRVSAMAYALKGDLRRSRRHLERATAEAARLRMQLEVARIHQVRGDLLPASDPRRQMYYELAGANYRRLGALALLRSLPAEHQEVDEPSGSSSLSGGDGELQTPGRPPSKSDRRSELSLDWLVQIAQEIGKLGEPTKLQEEILRVATEQTGAQSGCIFLYNPEKEPDPGLPRGLTRVASYVQGEAASLLPSTSVLEQVLRTRDRVIVGDAQEDLSGARSVMLSKKRSLLCAPMVVGRRMVGLLYLENNLLSRVFSARDLEAVGILSAQAVIALENSSYLAKAREAHRSEYALRRLFQSYVPPAVVHEVLRRNHEGMLKGERRVLTALFADIRGFTGLSEELDPEQLLVQLNELFAAISEVINDCHGIVDKFIGDAVMALFGVPNSRGNDALNAVTAAVRIQQAVRKINARSATAGRRPVALGIGVNSGEAVVGNVGSQQRMEYTAVGDTINLASGVEATTSTYRTGILITEHTRVHLGEAFGVRQLESIRVGGRARPVRLYEVLGRSEQMDPDQAALLETFQRGLGAYEQGEWLKAESAFGEVIRACPQDGPASVFLQRVIERHTRGSG